MHIIFYVHMIFLLKPIAHGFLYKLSCISTHKKIKECKKTQQHVANTMILYFRKKCLFELLFRSGEINFNFISVHNYIIILHKFKKFCCVK